MEEMLPSGAPEKKLGQMIFEIFPWGPYGRAASGGALALEPPRAICTQPEFILTVPNFILMSKNQVEPLPSGPTTLGPNVPRVLFPRPRPLGVDSPPLDYGRVAATSKIRAWQRRFCLSSCSPLPAPCSATTSHPASRPHNATPLMTPTTQMGLSTRLSIL